MLKNIIHDKKGSVLPLVAIAMVVLLGFTAIVVDAGSLYVDRRAMVTAADAAALAGAYELSLGNNAENAKNAAIEVAFINGVTITDKDIDIEKRQIIIPETGLNDNREIIEVRVKKNRELTFAKFIGHDNADVVARAIATWGFVMEVKGGDILPLFLTDEAYNSSVDDLHDGKVIIKGTYAGGNWGYIDIEKNWPTMQELLAGTKKTTYHFNVGEIVISANGNKQSVDKPIEDRIDAASLLPNKEERRQYMLGLVPIIDELKLLELNLKQPSGNLDNPLKLPIKFFAVYEVEDIIEDNSNNGYYKALDKPEYISNNSAETYPGLSKGTIVGSFTGDHIELNEVMNPGDQNNPNPGGVRPATYFKLIE